jgi:hypothetical protein
MYTQNPDKIAFAHRANPDGTFDSICTACFATISRQECEADLEQFERSHTCNPWELERFKQVKSENAADPSFHRTGTR